MSEKLQQIKDEYAREKEYEDWESYSFCNNVEKAWTEVCRRYATACCEATLEEASRNARIDVAIDWGKSDEVDKESITDPDNIVIL